MSILSAIIHQKYLPGRILVIIRISVAGVMLVVKGLIQVTSDNTQALLQKNIIYNLCNIILVQGIEYISTMKLHFGVLNISNY